MKIRVPDITLGYTRFALLPSLQCDANCRHCLFRGNLRKEKDYNDKFTKKTIEQAAKLVSYISITGGEPFFDTDRLLEIATYANNAECLFDLVTNGLWYRRLSSKDAARELLIKLRKLGLDSITFSYDDYHRPALSRREIESLVDIAISAGIPVAIKSCGSVARENTRKLKRKYRRLGVPLVTETFSLENTGTGKRLPPDLVARRLPTACELLATPVILPDGTLYACCSAQMLEAKNDWLKRGNVKKGGLARLLKDAENDFRLIAAAALGPGGFARILGIKPKENQTGCDFCMMVLNNRTYRQELERMLSRGKKLRKEVIGRFMLLSYKHNMKNSKLKEEWESFFNQRGKKL